ncbi:MAG TPA: hypothetical protein DCS67_09045 [Clostridiales bacterium UBA8960]|nr:hypothetical protein [Clostridiales bacterium UBA8960]
MTDSQIFTNRAKVLKNIFFLALIGFALIMIFSIGLAIWELSPLSGTSTYTVSYTTDQYGNRLSTVIESDTYSPFIQITKNLMRPTDQFKYSVNQVVVNITLISTIIRLPLLYALWLTYRIFKELSTSRTPFTTHLFDSIRRVGKVLVIYGLVGNIAFSILAAILVTGILHANNPIDFYMILLGFVLYVVSEIMEYGFRLQVEVDEML